MSKRPMQEGRTSAPENAERERGAQALPRTQKEKDPTAAPAPPKGVVIYDRGGLTQCPHCAEMKPARRSWAGDTRVTKTDGGMRYMECKLCERDHPADPKLYTFKAFDQDAEAAEMERLKREKIARLELLKDEAKHTASVQELAKKSLEVATARHEEAAMNAAKARAALDEAQKQEEV